MNRLSLVATAVAIRRRDSTEIWCQTANYGGRRMGESRRKLAAIALLAILAMAGWAAYRVWLSRPPAELEVAVFFPSTNVASWPDFQRAVRLVANEKGLEVIDDRAGRAVTVATAPLPIRFQWYPAIGSFEMQRSVRDACQRTNAPIAIVGANNTSMTEALGSEIRAASRPQWTPLLLMTTATADELIDLVPDRSFRFGFSNRCQARAVVTRLKELYQAGATKASASNPAVQAIIVQVLDNPFSLDLARGFERALKTALDAEIVAPPAEFRAADDSKASPLGWSLKTATGRGDEPTPEESQLAAAIANQFLNNPNARAVLVLPMGGDLFARFCRALDEKFRRDPRTKQWGDPIDRLAILSGDSLDYFDFAESKRGQVAPSATPGKVLFFSHANPLDASVGNPPDTHTPAIGLNREVVRTLVELAPTLGRDADPAKLAAALAAHRRGDSAVFERRERRAGGAAIVAIPDRARNRFDFRLPEDWASN